MPDRSNVPNPRSSLAVKSVCGYHAAANTDLWCQDSAIRALAIRIFGLAVLDMVMSWLRVGSLNFLHQRCEPVIEERLSFCIEAVQASGRLILGRL